MKFSLDLPLSNYSRDGLSSSSHARSIHQRSDNRLALYPKKDPIEKVTLLAWGNATLSPRSTQRTQSEESGFENLGH